MVQYVSGLAQMSFLSEPVASWIIYSSVCSLTPKSSLLFSLWANWLCLKGPSHQRDVMGSQHAHGYVLSAHDQHTETNCDALQWGRCSSLGICHPKSAQPSYGQPVWSGICSWHGRRQGGLQMNYFISGARSLCQERNARHSFPRGCRKCGIVVRFLLVLLKGFVCPDTKCQARGNPAGRLFQKD